MEGKSQAIYTCIRPLRLGGNNYNVGNKCIITKRHESVIKIETPDSYKAMWLKEEDFIYHFGLPCK